MCESGKNQIVCIEIHNQVDSLIKGKIIFTLPTLKLLQFLKEIYLHLFFVNNTNYAEFVYFHVLNTFFIFQLYNILYSKTYSSL